MSGLDTAYLSERAEHLSAEDILKWAWETFDHKVATSSSFQTQSVPLLHIISRVCPEMPVIFIDTGFHFPETLTFRDKLKERYGLNIKVMHPVVEQSQLFERYGEGLYRCDPDLCCDINKVEPMRRATSLLQALVSGIRRDQTKHRKILNVFEAQSTGLLRIHPLINWTQDDVWEYIHKHKLPFHPLFSKGYLSIGCAPCTRPVDDREDERAGRWAGKDKIECGLHLDWGDNANENTDKSKE